MAGAFMGKRLSRKERTLSLKKSVGYRSKELIDMLKEIKEFGEESDYVEARDKVNKFIESLKELDMM